MTTDATTKTADAIRIDLEAFAMKHGLEYATRGEVGFGRPCVGFTIAGHYPAYNPSQHEPPYDYVFGECDNRLYAPEGTPNSYHKDQCLAVLVQSADWENIPDAAYDAALRELHTWITHLESQGEIEIVEYEAGNKDIGLLMHGAKGHAIRFKESADVRKSPDAFKATVARVLELVKLLAEEPIELDALLEQVSREEVIGPFVDPTGYMEHATRLRLIDRAARMLREARGEARKIFKEWPAPKRG